MYDSLVRILKNVPLTRDYSDTLVFSNVSDQTTYFQSKTAYTFTDLMYIKDYKIQIPNQAGQYRDCNYIMWQNDDYPGKWFYGFILSVQYIADGTTEITFIEDFFQTWYFQMEVKECFVSREHVNNDAIGANIKEETVALGDYIINNVSTVEFNSWWIIIVSSVQLDYVSNFPPAEGAVYNGVYSGLEYRAFTLSTVDNIQSQLNRLAEEGKSDAIVSMYMVPAQMLSDSQVSGALISPYPQFRTANPPSTATNIDGYVPKNNKLFTYPFRGLKISNNAGENVVLRYEFFNGNASLRYRGTPFPSGRILVTPYNYKGKVDNYDFTITFSNYPQCAWLKDVYANWLATESVRYGYTQERIRNTAERGMLKNLERAGSGALTLNPWKVSNSIDGVFDTGIDMIYNFEDAKNNLSEEMEIHSMIPPSVSGSIGNESTLMSIGAYSIVMEEITITKEYAKSIDDYLSLFGYRIDKVKIPNIFGRKSWNYVQTVGAIVIGTAPSYAIENFRKLLNNGIRFWHGDYIGDFSRDNGVLT